MSNKPKTIEQIREELIEAGRELYSRNMVPATSGNFSARVNENTIAITASGVHKGKLKPEDIILIDAQGKPIGAGKPSAETGLHLQIYAHYPDAQYILHPHGKNATLISQLYYGEVVLRDYELLKAFAGINTHTCRVSVPIYDNDQNIDRLAGKIAERMSERESLFGYLIAGHGFYTWAESIQRCLNYVEAFDFLFDCELTLRRKTQ